VSTIRRTNRPADNFAIISNEFLRDGRVSFRARGIGGWLLSHETGWETTTERIAEAAEVGRDQIRSALRELEAAGYLRRTRTRSGGLMGPMVYEVQCTPFEDAEEDVSAGQNHRLENQSLVNQPLAGPPYKKTNSKKTNLKDSCPPPAGEALFDPPEDVYTGKDGKGGGGVSSDPSDPSAVFASFWAVYPRKIGKAKARTAFASALGKTSADDLVTGARRYADYVAWSTQDPRFVKHPTTWLNGECWEDDLPQRPAQRDVRDTDWESDVG